MTRKQFTASFCAEDWKICTRSWDFVDLVEADRYGDAHILSAKLLGAIPLKYRGRALNNPHPDLARN